MIQGPELIRSSGSAQTATCGSKELPNEKPLRAFCEGQLRRDGHQYGLIAAGISVATAVVNGLGTTLNTKFTDIKTQLK